MQGHATIKILVCYHKPFLLFENEILTPIQGGRACVQHSKDGALPAQDNAWLHEHMMGDDTGDNLSAFNREINEWTAIYWARRNYRSLLQDPDYIGLMHYSRLLDVSGLATGGRAGCTLESALGLCRETLHEVCASYDLVIARGSQLADAHELHVPPQPPLPLSDTYHPLLYRQCQRYEKEGLFFGYNMFIMTRALFHAFTDECLPLLADLLGMDPALRIAAFAAWNEHDPSPRRSARRQRTYLQFGNYYPRYTGYTMELMSSYFFMSVMERQPRQVAQVPVLHILPMLRGLEPQWQAASRRHLVRLMSSVLPSYSLRHRFRDYHAAESAMLRRRGPEELKERLRRIVLCGSHDPALQSGSA